MLPILLNMTDRLVAVIGGGLVGRRKASAILAAGGKVRLVCLEPRPAHMSDPCLEWRTEAYTSAHLDGASLAFAAGPAELNARIVADARSRGMWVNAASAPASGDFFLPATVRRGDFVLAISSGGAAPVLTQTVRTNGSGVRRGIRYLGFSAVRIAPAGDRTHHRVRAAKNLLTALCQWQWLDRLRKEDVQVVREAMRAAIEAFAEP